MRGTLLGIAAGAAALAMSAEAGACTILPRRPLEMPRQPSLAERNEQSSQPFIANLIRSAAFVDIAVVDTVDRDAERAEFRHVLALNGGGGDFFIEQLGGVPVVGTGAHWDETSRMYLDHFRDRIHTLEATQLPFGDANRTSCGNAVGAYLREGWTYLVVHEGNGAGSFAIPLTDYAVSNDPVELESLATHQWVAAANHALNRPADRSIRSIHIRDYLTERAGATIIEVQDCRAPAISTVEVIGSGGSIFWLEDNEVPLTLDDYLASDLARSIWLLPDAAPIGEADFAVLDERRYDTFPFDAESCVEGQQYLVLGWYRIFEINEFDMVDFSDIPTQLRVLDAGLVPLSTVRFWLSQDDE